MPLLIQYNYWSIIYWC